MASYSLEIAEDARPEFEAIPFPARRSVNQKVCRLRSNPYPQGCESVGGSGRYRLRVAGWVVLYRVREPERRIVIVGYRPEGTLKRAEKAE